MSAARYAWMASALCAQADPDAWMPGPGGDLTVPKRVCGRCPVRPQCAAHEQALRDHDRQPLHGTWAGLSKRQRAQQHQQAA